MSRSRSRSRSRGRSSSRSSSPQPGSYEGFSMTTNILICSTVIAVISCCIFLYSTLSTSSILTDDEIEAFFPDPKYWEPRRTQRLTTVLQIATKFDPQTASMIYRTPGAGVVRVLHEERVYHLLFFSNDDLTLQGGSVMSNSSEVAVIAKTTDTPLKVDTKEILIDYVETMMAAALTFSTHLHIDGHGNNCMILGLGAGSLSNIVTSMFPEMKLEVVEIDQGVVQLNAVAFALPVNNPNLSLYVGDAMQFDAYAKAIGRYDLILVDCYKGSNLPDGAITKHFISKLHTATGPGGTTIFNLFSQNTSYVDQHALIEGIIEVFPTVYILESMIFNQIIVASKSPRVLSRTDMMHTFLQRRNEWGIKHLQPRSLMYSYNVKETPKWKKYMVTDWHKLFTDKLCQEGQLEEENCGDDFIPSIETPGKSREDSNKD